MKARLLHFYSFKEVEVDRMAMSKVVDYNTCIDIMNAQAGILAIQASSFTKYKTSTQHKIMNKLKTSADTLVKKTGQGLATYGDTLKALEGMLSSGR